MMTGVEYFGIVAAIKKKNKFLRKHKKHFFSVGSVPCPHENQGSVCHCTLLFRNDELYGFVIMMLCLQNTTVQWMLASSMYRVMEASCTHGR